MVTSLGVITSALEQSRKALSALIEDRATLEELDRVGRAMSECFRQGGRVIACGNGGSMCDAMHFAEELSGRFRKDRDPLAAMAISDPSHLSCTANDFGYDEVFARFIKAHCRPGDVLLAISTSGTSKNVIKAAEAATGLGVTVVALTGKKDCALGVLADLHIATPGGTSYADRTQELHIKCIHILIELVERNLFSTEY